MNRTNTQAAESSHNGEGAVQPELPHLTAYLARLGEPVKLATDSASWLRTIASQVVSTPVQRETAHPPGLTGAPQYRRRSGDRRMSAEQRRSLIEQSDLKYYRSELPYWSAYLAWLGAQVKHAANSKHWRRVFFKPAVVKLTSRVSELPASSAPVSRPIGDRRTRVRTRRNEAAPLSKARVGLGIWSYYFIAKLCLYGLALIAFHPLLNLALAAFILLQAPSGWLSRIKRVSTVPLAVALLYYDSWLPSIDRLLAQASSLSSFSLLYLIELLGRFVSWPVLGAVFLAWLVCWGMSRWLRVGALVVVGMLAVAGMEWLAPANEADVATQDMDKVLADFFVSEARRSVALRVPRADETPFDVIFIHVCSLSWDDVRAVGLEQHPLWKRFDILLTRFNGAASYSGPAVLHFLRATCGQPEHGKMYVPAADNCYLMNRLQDSGFGAELALNHDGKFDDFLGQIKQHGRLNAASLPLEGLAPAQRSFDDSPVYDDLTVLSRWLENRNKNNELRVSLYYNTVSMHDGNHLPGTHSSANTLATYKLRLVKFLDEMELFMQKLDQSGRRAVVVMVPEHGGGVRGDKRQIAGLREIPTPAITLVPVGIMLAGGDFQHEEQTRLIDQPTSYLAISHIIARMLEKSPFNNSRFSPADYVADMPVTPFVSQNEKTTVIEYRNRYYLNRGDAGWESDSEFAVPAASAVQAMH